MNGKRRAFRPVLSEVLEDRTVPSSFSLGRFFNSFGGFGGLGGLFGRGTTSVPARMRSR